MIDKSRAIKINKELLRIAAKSSGRLEVEAVVREATNPKHLLHAEFTWDNRKAAHQHRLEQARELIRSVKVVIEFHERTITSVVWRRDPRLDSKQQGYVHIDDVRKDVDLSHEVLVDEFALAASALRRARDTAAALEMTDEIEEVLVVVEALTVRASAGPSH